MVEFYNTTPPFIGAELWQYYSYYIYIKGTLKVLRKKKGGVLLKAYNNII